MLKKNKGRTHRAADSEMFVVLVDDTSLRVSTEMSVTRVNSLGEIDSSEHSSLN